ncbi:MAG: phosphoribosyl-AMP cyclohydrolase [Lachnoanaerobaculum sp.]|nr:MAG: phosphoribosyl-AMP cyclohydrolase [Lachnoanaerobaculum sp.]
MQVSRGPLLERHSMKKRLIWQRQLKSMNKSEQKKYRWAELKKLSDGLLPVVVQDDESNQVLMVAYMNEEAWNKTLETGTMTYYSRSRKELWVKGATSGHYQYVKSLYLDCDYDTLLAKVEQVGAACHTGSRSCFFHQVEK